MDALNIFNHEICFHPDCTIFILRECADAEVVQKTTVLKLPTYFELDNATGEYHWPRSALKSCEKDTRHAIFVAPIQNITSSFSFPSTNDQSFAATTENTTTVSETEIINTLSTTNTKRNVHLQLMHHRLGHRSIELLLLGNSDNIWNDVTVKKDPETVCKTCQITLARRAARNRIHPDNYPTTPGTMVMVDIISNPFDFGLTIKSNFRYFILFVDVFSSFPVLLGINNQSAGTVIQTLQLYHTMFCPTTD
jgi:hypothetical protein